MLAALGLFVFELKTFPFADLARRTGWNHARSDRFGAIASSQFTGPGQDALSIGGAIVPEAAGSFGAIRTLRLMADEGDAYPFVDGSGAVWGQFVIVGMDEGRKHLLVDGTPRLIDFSLELERVA